MIGVIAPSRRRNRWFAWGLALGIVGPAVVLGGLSIVSSQRSSELKAERRAFVEYEQAIERAVQRGGFAVTQGMKPGLADIAEGALPDATLVTMARGWKGVMEREHAELAAIEPPAFLKGTAHRYGVALAAYVEVGRALVSAAKAGGAERAALVKKIPALGSRADELWSRAEADLERHRTRIGLGEAGRNSEARTDGQE